MQGQSLTKELQQKRKAGETKAWTKMERQRVKMTASVEAEKKKRVKSTFISVCMCDMDSPVCCNECAGAKREQSMCSLIGFSYPSLY